MANSCAMRLADDVIVFLSYTEYCVDYDNSIQNAISDGVQPEESKTPDLNLFTVLTKETRGDQEPAGLPQCLQPPVVMSRQEQVVLKKF